MIASNIRHLRTLKKLSQEALAKDLKITRSRIGSYEEARSEPSIDMLIAFSDYFKLPIDILLRTDLSKTKDGSFLNVGTNRILFPMVVDLEDDDLIEVVPVKASAGYLNGYDDPEYIDQLQKIKLPFLPTGKHRAFPIKGDSMLPLKDGSFVVGQFIEDLRDLQNGRTYVVLTASQGMVYKRVYNQIKENNCLLLVSDNKSYAPYLVPAEDILELWEFTCCINTQEYDQHELQMSSIIRMFNELGVELKALEKMIQ
ncbi:XRE family transcriptional regulator [Formosa algae]|uniref:Transcriptional regulator with XRE-family HTH domain n=1 Tax=Formosa algae TaxID=225843 RepID=A0A9X1CA49_9FLAO|nr:XRE family transcriptional regulator [Formosa algae]MBP1841413.1 transcriptional regulator with XRE-family HTH domain [Formosa algae]MDQ0336665.1 transcriptional regulator with XRE-family HTH domain [Formosa algae]OEI81875.1 XRE family transcriptional regulator [Formosa algae]PNW28579.1 XRE family transcriptional regulator [Formosa algae]